MFHAHIEYLPSPFADGRVPPSALPPGPFTPPADYLLETEFQQPVPRPIPEASRMGRHARTNVAAKLVCLSLASVSLSLVLLPQAKDWAVYIIPCGYLKWIGLLYLAMWAIAECAAARTGIAEIHRGFLGWTWVNTIRPDVRAPPAN